jgi:NADH-quinone oxidoreductase subunit A
VLIEYLPIVTMAALAIVFGVASLLVSRAFRPHRPNPVKLSAYESGNDPVRLPRGEKFSVKFYVVAMLFIVFDIEIIFLFPWAVRFRQLGLFGLIEMAFFIGLVFIAYVYIWRTGGFEWGDSVGPPVEGPPREAEPDPMVEADADLAAAMRDAEAAGAR